MFSSTTILLCLALRAAEPGPSGEKPHEAAERLFEEGERLYQAGRYEAAIDHFSRAYQLFPAPIIIFDIAQAHRLRGDCGKAVVEYRRFRQAAPNAPERALADEHLGALERTCPDAPPAPPPPAAERAGPPSPLHESAHPPLPPLRSPQALTTGRAAPASGATPAGDPSYRWLRFAALTVGLAAGAVATLTELEARESLARWKIEDRRLIMGSPATDAALLDDWIARQRDNDRLARSIGRRQRVSRALGGLGVAALLAGTVLSFPYVVRW